MNLIFLDIDGVLNNDNFHSSIYFDESNLFNLKKLILETDSYIVLSSYWRLGEDLESFKENYFDFYGLSDRLIGFTPFLGFDTKRGEEIKSFLNTIEYKNFVIIDDDNDMCELCEFLIQTDAKYGFTYNDYIKCLEILSNK